MRKALCRAASSVLLVLVALAAQPLSARAATCADASWDCTCASGFCWVTNAPVMPTQNDFFNWCTSVIGSRPVESQGRVPGVDPRSLVCPCTPASGAVMQPAFFRTPMGVFLGFTALGIGVGGALGASAEASKSEEQIAEDRAQGKPDAITQGMMWGGGTGSLIGGFAALGMTLKIRNPIPGPSWWNNARFFFFRGRTGGSRVGVSW